MNDQMKAAIEMTEGAVRAHRTTGARLGVVDEYDQSFLGKAIDNRTGEEFPVTIIKRKLVTNDMRYAIGAVMMLDVASGDVWIMIAETLYAPLNAAPFEPKPVFKKEIQTCDLPVNEDSERGEAALDARANEFKQLIALGVRAAERHRDLAAPAEEIHACGNPECAGNGRLPSEVMFAPEEITYVDLEDAAPAASVVTH